MASFSVGEKLFLTGCFGGCTALASACVASPIGLLGGLGSGLATGLGMGAASFLSDKFFGAIGKSESLAARITKVVLCILAGVAANWVLIHFSGMRLLLGSAVILNVMGIGICGSVLAPLFLIRAPKRQESPF